LRKIIFFVTGILILILLLSFPWPGFFFALQGTRLSDEKVLFSLSFCRHHAFDLSFTNSLYQAPVVEKFEIIGSDIHLREIQTNHWGVVDYYQIPGKIQTDGNQIRIREIQFHTSDITLVIGFIGKQRLIWDDRVYPLYEQVEPGNRLHLQSQPISPARYCWAKLMTSGPTFHEILKFVNFNKVRTAARGPSFPVFQGTATFCIDYRFLYGPETDIPHIMRNHLINVRHLN
jgi:hypothetical protein